ncbi:hypothetical protein [Paenibacillus polymyxa]|uniref:hypothetical protein n=1 Tax=Paenibacillus polymyxa TaxID=1406 RepID=UPI0003D32598|nr:hypothetical protein [Paenibacillus polymyxa]AHC22699.1 hypothetical protein X809_06405 [Paenibacillus polymyxa CR1]
MDTIRDDRKEFEELINPLIAGITNDEKIEAGLLNLYGHLLIAKSNLLIANELARKNAFDEAIAEKLEENQKLLDALAEKHR